MPGPCEKCNQQKHAGLGQSPDLEKHCENFNSDLEGRRCNCRSCVVCDVFCRVGAALINLRHSQSVFRTFSAEFQLFFPLALMGMRLDSSKKGVWMKNDSICLTVCLANAASALSL